MKDCIMIEHGQAYKINNFWAIGQTAKMSACHAVRSGFDSRIARINFKSLAATKLVDGDLDALIVLLQ